jgi:hypothetical protein
MLQKFLADRLQAPLHPAPTLLLKLPELAEPATSKRRAKIGANFSLLVKASAREVLSSAPAATPGSFTSAAAASSSSASTVSLPDVCGALLRSLLIAIQGLVIH